MTRTRRPSPSLGPLHVTIHFNNEMIKNSKPIPRLSPNHITIRLIGEMIRQGLGIIPY